MSENRYTGTETEKNLKTAFSGESEARNKYTFFASVAKKEGYEQIAALFQKTADNEKEHAKMWFKELNGIGDTAPDSLKQQKKKAFQNLQQSSALQLRLKNIMKKDIELYLKMQRLQKYLKRVK